MLKPTGFALLFAVILYGNQVAHASSLSAAAQVSMDGFNHTELSTPGTNPSVAQFSHTQILGPFIESGDASASATFGTLKDAATASATANVLCLSNCASAQAFGQSEFDDNLHIFGNGLASVAVSGTSLGTGTGTLYLTYLISLMVGAERA